MYGVCDLKPILWWWPPSRTRSTARKSEWQTQTSMTCGPSLLSLFQAKWQTCHLKCMNTLCSAQQRSSSTSWRIHPWGTMIGIPEAKLQSCTQLPVLITEREARGLSEGRAPSRVNPGRCVNAGWGESLVSVSGSGQRGRDYSTNPIFVWHQRWSLNPDCCCIAITSLLVCQQTPLHHPQHPQHTNTTGQTPAVGLTLCG